jgi:hypothetical protein
VTEPSRRGFRPRSRRVAFLALSLAALLLAFEIALRLALALPPTGDKSLEGEWEWARSRLALGRARAPDDDFAFDPVLGWRLEPNLRTPTLRTNGAGIRDDREIPLAPRPGERRIALMGDSFTFGHDVLDHETFGWFLEESIGERATVLNFGVPSYGTDQALLMFEERARRFRPAVAVLGFFLQDYQRNILWFRDFAKPMFVPEGPAPGLRLVNVPVISPEALYEEYASGRRRIGGGRRSYALGLVARALYRLSLARVREGAPAFVVLAGIMARFQASARDAGAEPVWLVLPNDDAVYDPGSRWATLEELTVRRARALGLRCLSMTPALRAFAKAEPGAERIFQTRTGSGHYTPEANRVVARELERFLGEAGLLGR